jgi:hypothetical protein
MRAKMSKLRFLLFDANVVFQLHEAGWWEKVLDGCEVTLSRIVAEHEVKYYKGEEFDEFIDLSPYIKSGRLRIADAHVSQVEAFKSSFEIDYFEKLDPGEAESLCILLNAAEPYLVCSSDAIVFKALGAMNRSEQGKSLEEVLQAIGLSKKMDSQFSKDFRLHHTRQGQVDQVQRGVYRA